MLPAACQIDLLRLLRPPYQCFDRSIGVIPEPGSVIVATCDGDSVKPVEALARFLAAFRWCAPALVVDSSVHHGADFLSATRQVRGQLAVLERNRPHDVTPVEVIHAIRHRPPPDVQLLAQYVARASGNLALLSDLVAVLDTSGYSQAQSRPASTLRLHLRRVGRFSPIDWRRVGMLASLARVPDQSCESLSAAAGVEARTFRRWVRDMLHYGPQEFRAVATWEGILERAIGISQSTG